jgi:hypothetical protein
LSQFLPTAEGMQKAEAAERTYAQDKLGADAYFAREQDRRDREFYSLMRSKLAQESKDASEIKPWNPITMAPPKHDLWEQFGSPGFLIAMMASSFTAMPMVSALNSGAAAMNAINQGDLDGYNRAFDEWKANTDLAIKRHSLEHQEFEDIGQLWDKDIQSGKARMAAYLAQIDDKRKMALLTAGMDTELWGSIGAIHQSFDNIIKTVPAMLETKALLGTLNKDERWTKATDQLGAYTDAVRQINEAKFAGRRAPTLTGDQQGEINRRFTQWLKDHPEASSEDQNQARDQIVSSVIQSYHPIEARRLDLQQWRDQAKVEADKVRQDLAERKLTLEQAKAAEDARHKQRMEDIAEGRIGAQADQAKARQDEIDRHNKEMEKLGQIKAEKAGTTKAALEERDKADIREDVIKDHPEWTKGQIAEEVDRRYAAATAKRSGTPEAVVLNKFMEENPQATAGQLQAFRALAKSGRSPLALAVSRFVAEHPEATAEDITRFGAFYNRAQAYARTTGVRAANVDVAVQEAKSAAKLALDASDKVPRTDYVSINKILQNIREGTSTPEQRSFSVANASLITAYAQTMSRTGTNTVTAQNRAAEVLNTADGREAYKAGVEMLLMEMRIVQDAVIEVSARVTQPGGTAPKSADPYKLK